VNCHWEEEMRGGFWTAILTFIRIHMLVNHATKKKQDKKKLAYYCAG